MNTKYLFILILTVSFCTQISCTYKNTNNSKDEVINDNQWQEQLPLDFNSHETAKKIIGNLNDIVTLSVKIVTTNTVREEDYDILGIYRPYGPKAGLREWFSFYTSNTSTRINVDKSSRDINNITIFKQQLTINKSEINLDNLIFIGAELIDNNDQSLIKHRYQVKGNDDVIIELTILLRAITINDIDYLKKHPEEVKDFKSISIYKKRQP